MNPRAFLLLLCLPILVPASPARADEAETEYRLKKIGVDADLRAEVRTAIDRGVAYLAKVQRDDGRWVHPNGLSQVAIQHGDGLNALCALALVHADTEAARVAADKAEKALFRKPGFVAPQLQDTVYGAGIGLMLMQVMDRDKRSMNHVARRMMLGRDPGSGSWNYRTGRAPTTGLQPPPGAPKASGPLNLSTAQFAVLGLHAASTEGIPVPSGTWTDVLNGLLVSHKEDGSWAYSHHHPAIRDTYTVGTFMGAANLVLSAHHLNRLVRHRSSRRKRITQALDLARESVAWDGIHDLWYARHADKSLNLYGLWSLEKACIFLDVEDLDGIPWYAHLARTLVDRQRDSGAWGGGHGRVVWGGGEEKGALINTAFALLILVRDMETQRVATPRPITLREVATGEETEGPALPPLPDAIPADVAHVAVERARMALFDRESENSVLIDRLRWLERARENLGPPADKDAPVDPDELLARIEGVLVDAMFLVGEDPDGDRLGRARVNSMAAGALTDPSPELLLKVRKALSRFHGSKRKKEDVAVLSSPYRPVMRWLARNGTAEVLPWMISDFMHSDTEGCRAEASLAVLLAIPEFKSMKGRTRAAAADEIRSLYIGSEGNAVSVVGATTGSLRPRVRWSRFRPRVMNALLHLSRDTRTGEIPVTDEGDPLLTVKAWRKWRKRHGNPSRAPWR